MLQNKFEGANTCVLIVFEKSFASNSDAPRTAFTQLSRAETMSATGSPGADQMDVAILRMLGGMLAGDIGMDESYLLLVPPERHALLHLPVRADFHRLLFPFPVPQGPFPECSGKWFLTGSSLSARVVCFLN